MRNKADLQRDKKVAGPFYYVLLLVVVMFLLVVAVSTVLTLLQPKAVYHYTVKTEAVNTDGHMDTIATAHRIELNGATREELMTLPGIGEKTAEAIIAFREENGGLHYVEDLLAISGIGDAKLAAIYDMVYIQ